MGNKLFEIRDRFSQQVLYSDVLENSELVYKKAVEYEQMGLDVEIVSPGVSEQLARELGATEEDLEKLKKIISYEIDSHEDSCCK
ncbi:MAG: hypothetical protein H6622_06770 [Halobacteriovoraceae bacterium]|nr:hypothetical protein [Halobacteriovoraceae bacterium]